MPSDKPPVLQKTYDTNDAKLQWRCHMHAVHKPRNLLLVAAVSTIVVLVGRQPPIFIIVYALMIMALSFVQIALVVKKRTSQPRRCTTTISQDGVRDQTPDADKTFTWREILDIEITQEDIFFTTRSGGLFIPQSAFADEASRSEFYMQAKQFWQASRGEVRNLQGLPSSQGKGKGGSRDKGIAPADAAPQDQFETPKLEDLLAEDESVWTALEEEHKKQNAPGKGPDLGDK